MTKDQAKLNKDQTKQLLGNLRDRISVSTRFGVRSRPILQLLLKNAIDELPPLSDQDIGDSVFKTDNPYESPAVRKRKAQMALHHVNNQLARFFSAEAKDEPQRIVISAGDGQKRQITLTQNIPPPRNYVLTFWEPYLGHIPNMIIYTEPLFFRRKNALTYVREVHCNETGSVSKLKGVLKRTNDWVPSYHYVSSGEVMAVLRLVSELSYQPVAVLPKRSYSPPHEPLPRRSTAFIAEFATAKTVPPLHKIKSDTHLIIIGSGRTSLILRELQNGLDFTIEDDCIRVRNQKKEEKRTYEDENKDVARETHLRKYAVVSRYYEDNGCITLIAANHGRAAQGAAEVLTDQNHFSRVITGKLTSPDLPRKFQLILEVPLSKEADDSYIRTDLIRAVAVRAY